ncbi:tripartite tricarboxylate transporter TctB family protein [Salinithrix halophila]|uniref:Tripartite tricarboxylate transporter TctB family protein n=1 Tax=Salinithrix halophila TaxID=1485204 RepID=A0ABV8J8R4_9BACL
MTRDRQASIVLMIIAVLYLLFSYRLPSYALAVMDADALPIGLGWLLLVLAVLLFFFGEKTPADQEDSLSRKEWGVLGTVLGATLLYVFFLEWLGFVLVTIPFILGVTVLLGYRRWGVNVTVALGFTGVMYYAFTYLLNITLPQGPLPF